MGDETIKALFKILGVLEKIEITQTVIIDKLEEVRDGIDLLNTKKAKDGKEFFEVNK